LNAASRAAAANSRRKKVFLKQKEPVAGAFQSSGAINLITTRNPAG
jgi:hypothetical protein